MKMFKKIEWKNLRTKIKVHSTNWKSSKRKRRLSCNRSIKLIKLLKWWGRTTTIFELARSLKEPSSLNQTRKLNILWAMELLISKLMFKTSILRNLGQVEKWTRSKVIRLSELATNQESIQITPRIIARVDLYELYRLNRQREGAT